MKKLFLGYLVIGFLLVAGVGFGYRAMQYDQTLESSNKHMSYLNRLSSKDFVTEEQISKNLEYIKKINEFELRFYRSLNEIIKSMAEAFLGCATIQAAFLIFLHQRKKMYNQNQKAELGKR